MIMATVGLQPEQLIIAEVMEEKNVSPDDIPVESPFVPSRPANQIDGSKRYFRVKGFAWFREHDNDGITCTRTWPSAHSWCIMDLKQQRIVKRFSQDCQKCEGSAQPEFEEEAIRRMAEYAVKSYLIRSGKLQRDPLSYVRDPLDDHEGQQPHDQARCGMCQALGRSCWK